MKLGLVCISELLREKDPSLAFKTITRAQFLKEKDRDKAINTLSVRILHNLLVSYETIKHCSVVGIKHYRLSSSIFPLVTDATLGLDIQSFPRYPEIEAKMMLIGRVAKSSGVSLSLHPDQYVVLGSNSDDVCRKSIKELNFLGWMLDQMGCDRDYSCPMNIHPSLSNFDSAEGFVDKFVANYFKCDESVRLRLVLENEHHGFWTCSNLYEYFHNYVKNKYNFFFPLTLDNLHDQCNPSLNSFSAPIPYRVHFLRFYNTWPATPIFHWSEGIGATRSHCKKLTTVPPDFGLDVIYEIEVKDKDRGFKHLLPYYKHNPV